MARVMTTDIHMPTNADASLVHYAPDNSQQAVTLCGSSDSTAIVVWERARVTCEACASRFDRSLQQLRQHWTRVKRRTVSRAT